MPVQKSDRFTWLGVIPLLLLATWLSARMLDADLLWSDETRAYMHAGLAQFGPRSLLEILDWIIHNAFTQSPGYFLMLSGWSSLTGSSEFATRAFSLLLGVLTIAWAYRLGRDMFAPRIGLYAVVGLSGSAIFIVYMHEARQYMLFALLTCITVWAYWRLIQQGRPSLGLQAVLFLGVCGLAYTHWLALLTPLALGIYHLLFVPKNRQWWHVPVIMVLAALAFLPWVVTMLTAMIDRTEEQGLQDIAMTAPEILRNAGYAFSNGNLVLLLIVIGAAVIAPRPRGLRLLLTWLIGGLAIALTIHLFVPSFIHVRYLMGLWPVLALLVALGIHNLARPRIPAVFWLALWLAGGVLNSLTLDFYYTLPNAEPYRPRAGFAQALDVLREQAQPDDVIALHVAEPGREYLSYFVLNYYMEGIPGHYFQLEGATPYYEVLEAGYREAVSQQLDHAPFVWVGSIPEVPTTRRRTAFYDQLSADYALCETVIDREDMQLELFARQPEEAPQGTFAVGDDPADAISVFNLAPLAQFADGTLDVRLGWAIGRDIPAQVYSAALHLYDADNQLVSQVDYGLPDERYACRTAHMPLTDLPPGEYTVRVLVYAWETGERLPTATGDEDSSTLGRFTLAP